MAHAGDGTSSRPASKANEQQSPSIEGLTEVAPTRAELRTFCRAEVAQNTSHTGSRRRGARFVDVTGKATQRGLLCIRPVPRRVDGVAGSMRLARGDAGADQLAGGPGGASPGGVRACRAGGSRRTRRYGFRIPPTGWKGGIEGDLARLRHRRRSSRCLMAVGGPHREHRTRTRIGGVPNMPGDAGQERPRHVRPHPPNGPEGRHTQARM